MISQPRHYYLTPVNARTVSEAMALWEGTGTAVAEAAQAVTALLSAHNIPSLVAGGLAVQLQPQLWDVIQAEPRGPSA